MVAHLRPHHLGHPLAHDDFAGIALEDFLVTVHIAVEIAAAGIRAEAVLIPVGEQTAVGGDHIRPDLIDVGGVGEVHHVRRIAARRTHIDFESNEITDAAKPLLCLRQAEELEMDEAAAHAERFERGASRFFERIRYAIRCVVGQIELIEHDVHDGRRPHGHGFENGHGVRIDDGVVGTDVARHELLHDVGDFGL